jgi:mevalonate kinase
MGTAGGKVILCGEHAVVHGGDALVVGLNRGVIATASHAAKFQLIVGGKSLDTEDASMAALRNVCAHLGSGTVAVNLEVTMPLGVGLGGSAAMAVAIARALGELANAPLEDDAAFSAAQVWERVFHGNPSGVDAAAATYGGCLLYNRQRLTAGIRAGAKPTRVDVGAPLHLALAVAGPPSLTKAMVERVAHFKCTDPLAFDAKLREIQAVVEAARASVESGDLKQLGALLNRNHALLSEWQLSTPEIEHARNLALSNGALGSKLTGAGGGGCVIALCEQQTAASAVLDGWAKARFQTLSTTIVPT